MKQKRHYRKSLVLDNCELLKGLEVKLPEELFYFEDKLKAVFKTLEEFYAKFFYIEDFVKDLSVVFYLQGRMTRGGVFCSCDSKTNKPIINIYNTVQQIESSDIAHVLAHEFAHYIDWKLGMIKNCRSFISEEEDTVENALAQKFLSFQEIKPSGLPVGGVSGSELNSNCELFARYLEEYYRYCFEKVSPETKVRKDLKNCLYVKKSDFESGLLEPVKEYLDFYRAPEEKETVIYEENLYSADKKTLLKYMQKDSRFVVPDFVESIGDHAFEDCDWLVCVEIGSGVKEIQKFAFHNCTSLKTVISGKNVHHIMWNAFGRCTELEAVKDFENVEIIGMEAFILCRKIKEWPEFNELKYVGNMGFAGCVFLENKRILENGAFVESWAFKGCKAAG